MNAMAQAVAIAFATAQATAGEAVFYHADGRIVPMVVVPGRTQSEGDYGSEGGIAQWHAKDWLLLAEDLNQEKRIIPERGHAIVDSAGQMWRLLDDGSTPGWRYNDQFRVVVRLHTKLASAEEC